MATLEYKRYHDTAAVGRTNDYILDGHGKDATARTNRYITDGHGGDVPYFANFCPRNAETATAYMNTLRAAYEAQNEHKAVIRGESKRRDVCHLQFFVSFAEHEDVPVEKMLEMAKALIYQTELNDYACLVVPHLNTWHPEDPLNPGNKHFHISVCPYPLPDGNKKLAMNDRMKREMQKAMDRICVAYGYSIIENPVLLADPAYKEWFDEVKAAGEVTIHPYHPEKRQRRARRSKQRNAASLSRAEVRSYNLMRRLDIRSMAELEDYIKSVGTDICILRKEKAYQTRTLDTLAPVTALIEQWEGKHTPAVIAALGRYNVRSVADVEKAKRKAETTRARLERNERLLISRKKEYGQLKQALHVLNDDAWHDIARGLTPHIDYDSDMERIRRANEKIQKWLDEDEKLLRQSEAEQDRQRWYVHPLFVSTKTNRPYKVCRFYSRTGRELSAVEALLTMALCVISKEGAAYFPTTVPPDRLNDVCYAKPNKKLQLMIDALAVADAENIQTPADIQRRLAEVGADTERYKRLKMLEYSVRLSDAERFVYGPDYSQLEQKIRRAQSTPRSEPVRKEKERPSR